MPEKILCADIGGSFIDSAVVHDNSVLLARQRVPTPRDDFQAFALALKTLADPHPGVALHIALAGLQDPETGLCSAANIPCLNNRPIARLLSDLLERPVHIGNDADCFALAESHQGVGRGHDSVFGIILGTGVGGGLVIGGKPVFGKNGLTGEWGHGPFVPDIRNAHDLLPCFPCGCGQRGCVDTIGGARGIERLYRWVGGNDNRESRAILDAWRTGDSAASRAIAHFLSYVSSALALAVNITGATVIAVGGGLSNAADLIDALDIETRRRILRRTDEPLVLCSSLGNDAGLIGATYLGR
ncbi:ROK family protein [Brytella acorum]|uniref:ROK family protein n=1 Tax=Brytella acorum TaxID=2959299 RepID=A0AA35UYA5_9PROT|nr:ROK family protein [Brytella acorum]MDF3625207.1 ROK family protein [Brytella acorum]CAI9119381.1 ROK family protein [Brytella acorum]